MAGSARVGEASGGIVRKKSTVLLTIGAGGIAMQAVIHRYTCACRYASGSVEGPS
jgi:hypothetical protein